MASAPVSGYSYGSPVQEAAELEHRGFRRLMPWVVAAAGAGLVAAVLYLKSARRAQAAAAALEEERRHLELERERLERALERAQLQEEALRRQLSRPRRASDGTPAGGGLEPWLPGYRPDAGWLCDRAPCDPGGVRPRRHPVPLLDSVHAPEDRGLRRVP